MCDKSRLKENSNGNVLKSQLKRGSRPAVGVKSLGGSERERSGQGARSTTKENDIRSSGERQDNLQHGDRQRRKMPLSKGHKTEGRYDEEGRFRELRKGSQD